MLSRSAALVLLVVGCVTGAAVGLISHGTARPNQPLRPHLRPLRQQRTRRLRAPNPWSRPRRLRRSRRRIRRRQRPNRRSQRRHRDRARSKNRSRLQPIVLQASARFRCQTPRQIRRPRCPLRFRFPPRRRRRPQKRLGPNRSRSRPARRSTKRSFCPRRRSSACRWRHRCRPSGRASRIASKRE